MKHLIIGGDGLVGRYLAAELRSLGEEVLIADINKSDHELYKDIPFLHLDIRDRAAFEGIPLAPEDIVHSLAAVMLSPPIPRRQRLETIWSVNCLGVQHLLDFMESRGASKLIHFSTDMVYGYARTVPIGEDHPTVPLGPYGSSKLASEELCRSYRSKGMRISIFRPRLIVGPGRLGILVKLFRLIDRSLPVPMIGSGENAYQFISAFDCVSAIRGALDAGLPNETYNLGSDSPPRVRELLKRLIDAAGSRSILVSTPAPLVKGVLTALDHINLPLMDPEQYLIADEHCILDTSKAKRELNWQPKFGDADMLVAAYREYRKSARRLA
jgi:dTDP-glucose 4,6-dehydratase